MRRGVASAPPNGTAAEGARRQGDSWMPGSEVLYLHRSVGRLRGLLALPRRLAGREEEETRSQPVVTFSVPALRGGRKVETTRNS